MTHVQIDDARIHYHVEGPDGAPVLMLLHALGTDLHMWDPQMNAFSARFRVVRYDSRGHGTSDAPPDPYTIERLADDAIGLLDALGITRACFCGISMGGLTALSLAARHPQRLERAVYGCTAAKIGSPDLWDERISMVRAGGMPAISDLLVRRYFSDSFRSRSPEAVERAFRTAEATSPEGYIASCYAVRDADLRDEVGSIRVPSLIVAGESDVSTPPAESHWLHEQIPDSRLLVLDHTAHLANIEEPDRFGEAVLGFLESGLDDRPSATEGTG